ncbi:MAG: hypothetical protein IPQ07_10925 [Myxococcales bacterium]|nr:hypothetical protein [Myxococcales bacterium]
MDKPEHLRTVESSPGAWLAQRPAATVAAALGLLSFIIVAVSQGELWATPDWRISVPCFAVTALASLASLARKEQRGYWLWTIGLGLAAAGLVLGWFLMFAIVIAGTAILMLILHAVM